MVISVLEMKKMVRLLVRQTRCTKELDSGEYDARIRQERAPRVQVLDFALSRGVLKRKGRRKSFSSPQCRT